jgi:hypothetical protein
MKTLLVQSLALLINVSFILMLQNGLQSNAILSFVISILPLVILSYALVFKNLKPGLCIAIALLYFYAASLAFMLVVIKDIDLFPIDYQLYSSTKVVVQHGFLDPNVVGNYLQSFKDYNHFLYLSSIYEIILGRDFRSLAPFIRILFPLVVFVITFETFKSLLHDTEKALCATLFSIFVYGVFQSPIPSGSLYSQIMFFVSFYFFTKAFNSEKSLANVLTYVVFSTSMVLSHPVASIALIVFTLSYALLIKDMKIKSIFCIYSLVTLVIFFVQTYTHTGFLLENMIISLLEGSFSLESVDIIRYHTAQIDAIKFFLDMLTYMGIVILIIYALIGFIKSLHEKSLRLLIPMILGGIILFCFTIIISGSFTGITDFTIRFIPYIFFSISPYASNGLAVIKHIFSKNLRNNSIRGIILSVSLFSALSIPLFSMPTYVYYRTIPLRSDEPIAIPEEWYHVGTFFKNFGVFPVKIYGAFNAYYIYALSPEKDVRVFCGHPLEFHALHKSANSYLVFSRLHLSLPDFRFGANKTISVEVFLNIINSSNIIYDSGNVLTFQVVWSYE